MKLKHSFVALFASIFVIAGSAYTFYKYQRSAIMKKLTDEKRQIRHIVQTGPEKEALGTQYLAEVMHLSADRPTPFDLFSTKDAEQKLRHSPVIKWARVRKQKPDTVYVEYEVRQPIAIIGDFANTAMDDEKALFPLYPFYAPKQIPELILGTDTFTTPLQGECIDLALQILTLCDGNFHPQRIDVSNAFHESLGRREVVILLKTEEGDTHSLRLMPTNLEKQLGNYYELELPGGDRLVVLLLDLLGFIE